MELPITLLAKLGSIAVHADELLSPSAAAVRGHEHDKIAIRGLIDDPEVQEWLKTMTVFLPVKR